MASFFDKKAKQWIEGRKNWKEGSDKLIAYQGKRIWFHCASLGEFEQARPVIEKYGCENRENAIIVSFFSPSGYKVRKNYESADWVTYLPLDSEQNAKEFLDVVRPDVALFVKYEFWYRYLNELKQRKIPVILFSSIFRKEQIFFKPYGSLFREMLGMFTKIFVQSKESRELLEAIGIDSVIAFDTRFDRVNEIAQHRKLFPAIGKFKGDAKIFIAGSSWKRDEELVLRLIRENILPGYKFIIAPHEVKEKRTEELLRDSALASKRFSELTEENAAETQVVIVDNTGNLASLYAYCDLAYIGGGFNASVHNVLEAAVFGMPVIFGPHFEKSLEAVELRKLLAAFSFNSYSDLLYTLRSINDNNAVRGTYASLKGKEYVRKKMGGAEVVAEAIHGILE